MTPLLSIFWHVSPPEGEAGEARLNDLAAAAWPLVWASPGEAESVFPALEEVEISVVEDAAIAQVHGQFMDDPTPTDVITFHHGEILVSADTAAREAAARAQPFLRELALYVIHGLLHLHGHTDAEDPPRALMHAAQERILSAVWPAGAD